mmetsp:Transcript_29109/g.71014  ORF Transcript_29109/g.71014 Transcript_29109/m.71014 type:complete len:118 (+) Transcript_29109:1916-2269(+)
MSRCIEIAYISSSIEEVKVAMLVAFLSVSDVSINWSTFVDLPRRSENSFLVSNIQRQRTQRGPNPPETPARYEDQAHEEARNQDAERTGRTGTRHRAIGSGINTGAASHGKDVERAP